MKEKQRETRQEKHREAHKININNNNNEKSAKKKTKNLQELSQLGALLKTFPPETVPAVPNAASEWRKAQQYAGRPPRHGNAFSITVIESISFVWAYGWCPGGI